MKNLQELSTEELIDFNGGGFRDIGIAIGNWLGNIFYSNGHCDTFSDSEIIGSASNNYVS